MNKYYKYGIIVGLLLILFWVINDLITPAVPNQILEYMHKLGYQNDLQDQTLLYKVDGNSTIYYFSLADYTFNQKIDESTSNVKTLLNQTYDFKTRWLEFNYRVEYSDNINVIFKGNYNEGVFTCDKEFSTASMSEEEKNNTCNLIRIKAERFYTEAQAMFNNYHFIEYMENAVVEE